MADVPVPDQVIRSLGPAAERALRCAPTLLYMLLIWFASEMPGDALPRGIDDRIAHFGEYALLAVLMTFALTAFDPVRFTGARLASSAFLCLAWAGLDELHQRWSPGRVPSLKDFAFDALGIGAALTALLVLARRWR